MPSKNPRVSVTNETKTELESLSEKLNLNLRETVEFLIENYKSKAVPAPSNIEVEGYTDSEQKEINEAITNSNLPLEQIIKEGTLQRVRYLNSVATNQAKLDSMSDDEIKEATFKGAANYRINQAIERIKAHNDVQGEKDNKVCITRGMIFKLTGSNRQTINKFFDSYHTMIDDHNQKHSLTDSDNRKGKNFDYKELLGME